MFSGDSEGPTREFGLEIDPFHINARDEMYWSSAYKLVVIEGSSFLSDIQEKVHLTGKSLSLLRLISPDHFMSGKKLNWDQLTINVRLGLGPLSLREAFRKKNCKIYDNLLISVVT